MNPQTILYEIKNLAEKNKKKFIKLLQQLIQIQSYSGKESEICEYIKNYFDELKIKNHIDPAGNVIAKVGKGDIYIAYAGHVDTVQVEPGEKWKFPPFRGVQYKGYIYGRGSVDMKGAIASMLASAFILREISEEEKLPFRVNYIFTVQEEPCEGKAIGIALKSIKPKPDIVVITEPSELGIVLGQRGRAEIEIKITGEPAHAAFPDEGFNPLYLLPDILKNIKILNQQLPSDNIIGKGSIAPVKIDTISASKNAIPSSVSIILDRRLNLKEKKLQIVKEIKNFLPEKATVKITKFNYKTYKGFTLTGENYYPSWKISKESVYITTAEEALREVTGKKEINYKYWQFSTDGTYTGGIAKIPTFGIGPGDERLAHKRNERININEVIKACEFYAYYPFVLAGRFSK